MKTKEDFLKEVQTALSEDILQRTSPAPYGFAFPIPPHLHDDMEWIKGELMKYTLPLQFVCGIASNESHSKAVILYPFGLPVSE